MFQIGHEHCKQFFQIREVVGVWDRAKKYLEVDPMLRLA